MPGGDISIIQSATASGPGTGADVVCTFVNPVGAHNTVVLIIAVENAGDLNHDGFWYTPGFTSPGYVDMSNHLNYGRLAQAIANGSTAMLYPNGLQPLPGDMGDYPPGPNIIAWYLQDGLGFGSSPYIAGLTQIIVATQYATLQYMGETKVAMYEVSGIAPGLSDLDGSGSTQTLGQVGVTGTTDALAAISSGLVSNAPPALLVEAIWDATNSGSVFSSSAGYSLTDNLNAGDSSLGIFIHVIDPTEASYGGDTITDTNSSANLLMVSLALGPVFVEGPPPPASPLRYKRVPFMLNFASCSYDQQNRLLMYELYRSLGLDPTNPFLLELLEGLSGTLWQPPYTLMLTVWGEAVDVNWSILKQVKRGQRITVDASVSQEWAGEYEVMETTYYPFAGDAPQFYGGSSGPVTQGSSASVIGSSDQKAGLILLKLRTYNASVFFDDSMTPSYINVPGPWVDGSY